jgi:5-methylcytosine-specific restriction enzyme A
MREEVVLALELFVRMGVNAPRADVRALSESLRALPVEAHLARDPAFRRRAAVRGKLGNFQWLATRGQAGYGNVGQLDRVVFERYLNVTDELFADADGIRRAASEIGQLPVSQQAALDTEADTAEGVDGDDPGVEEGELRVRLHAVRERKRAVVERRKAQALRAHGRLACEVCGLDFAAAYGPRGQGFIEVHHLPPLSELAPGQRTRARDLALLCCNCHRMVHRQRPWATLAAIRQERAQAGQA